MLDAVAGFLVERGVAAYYVGGYVRDRLLGRETRDIDIAVPGDAPALARGMASCLGGSFVLLDAEQGIARIVFPAGGGWTFDLSSMSGDIQQDLRRRDFTINAMAARVGASGFDVIDPLEGRKDIQERRIRAVCPSVFQDDPARLLRAVRLAAQFNFTIQGETEALVRRDAALLAQVAGERTREELCCLLELPVAARYLNYLDDLGLLTVIFPEMSAMKGVDQPKEHFWNVFYHSMQAVAALERLLSCRQPGADDDICRRVAPLYEIDALAGHMEEKIGNVGRSVLMKLATLLHDVAKPQTKSIESDGRVHFFGHSTEGAAVVKDIMGRLRFSGQQNRAVQGMVEHHLRPWQLSSNDMLPSRRAIYRYYRDVQDVAVDTTWLALADYLASKGPRLDMHDFELHVETMRYILAEGLEGETGIVSTAPLINGHDVLTHLGLQPGPEVGKLLQAVREAQAAGEICTREEALALARRIREAHS